MQDGSSTKPSQRSRYRRIFFLGDHVFIEGEFFFMEHSNFKVFPLIRRRLGVATLLVGLWYSQAPSIRPHLSKHDNNSFRFFHER